MRQTTILTLLLAAIMSVALFYLKYEGTDLEQELDVLNRAIVTDQEGIHVLKAEWSHRVRSTGKPESSYSHRLRFEPIR